MTISEARTLKRGTPVQWREDGYIITGKFLCLRKCTLFGKMTFNDISSFDFSNGKEELRAVVEYVWDNGKTYEKDISIRAMHLVR